jgi:hypothetical protein
MLSRPPDSPSGATRLRDCPALQVSYLSTRDRGAGHTAALNHILDCDCYHLGCFYDAGAHYRMPLRAADFTPGNYARLSVTGERKLAATESHPTLVALAAIA